VELNWPFPYPIPPPTNRTLPPIDSFREQLIATVPRMQVLGPAAAFLEQKTVGDFLWMRETQEHGEGIHENSTQRSGSHSTPPTPKESSPQPERTRYAPPPKGSSRSEV
jgi:hypothetical protein